MANYLRTNINLKNILFWCRYVIYSLAILILVDYSFFFYKTRMTAFDPAQEEHYNEKLDKLSFMLGWMDSDKKSSFVHFKQEKPPKVIRIGCFGDSFTFGDEVNDIYDYPGLLQSLFRKNGHYDIEVINFGIGGYGFHQAFILWQYVGREYGLDFVLLGPECFQPERDSTFNMSFYEPAPLFHSRYILKDNDVKLLDPIGGTVAERILNYWKFLPHFRYLRYDSAPPGFLTAPIACLAPNKQLRSNPFYYQKNIKREMDIIHRILLSKMSDNAPQVILGNYDENIVNLGESVGKNNLFSTLLYRPQHFPYIAFGGHNGPCGNALLAQQMFNYLTNKKGSVLNIIETEDLNEKVIRKIRLKKVNLSDYKDITVEINNVKVGRFYDSDSNGNENCSGPSCELLKNSFAHTASLIAWKKYRNNASILETVFSPLEFEINEETPVAIKVTNKSGTIDYPIGKLKLLNPELNIGEINLGRIIHFDSYNKTLEIKQTDFLLRNPCSIKTGDTVSIFVNDVPILSARVKNPDEELKFTMLNKRYAVISANGKEIVDVEKLKPAGIVNLALYTKQDKIIKVPFARWRKTLKKMPFRRIASHLGN